LQQYLSGSNIKDAVLSMKCELNIYVLFRQTSYLKHVRWAIVCLARKI